MVVARAHDVSRGDQALRIRGRVLPPAAAGDHAPLPRVVFVRSRDFYQRIVS